MKRRSWEDMRQRHRLRHRRLLDGFTYDALFIRGDANNDDAVDLADVDFILAMIAGIGMSRCRH